MAFKLIFIPLLILWQIFDVNAAEVSCSLPNSNAEATCVDLHECRILNADFLLPDKLEDYNIRRATCSSVSSNSICCENSFRPTSATSISVPTTTTKTPLPLPNSQEISPTLHKNYKLFDNSKCGISAMKDRVASGEDADLLEHPWAVRIGYRNRFNDTTYNCGGTLITTRYVLSAAHCLTRLPSNKKLYSVILGDYDTTTDPDCDPDDPENCADPIQEVLIESSVAHPKYDPNKLLHDIGIIRLSEPAKITQNNIKTICLPFNEKNFNKLGEVYEVIGWGATDEHVSSSEILQKAHLPQYDLQKCRDKIAGFVKTKNLTLIDEQLCAGGEEKIDACRGDSGGPLQAPVLLDMKDTPRLMQFGIVSYGVKYCNKEKGVPGVYTKVSKYLNWILDNMK